MGWGGEGAQLGEQARSPEGRRPACSSHEFATLWVFGHGVHVPGLFLIPALASRVWNRTPRAACGTGWWPCGQSYAGTSALPLCARPCR